MADNQQYRKQKGASGRKVKRFVISGMSVIVVTSSVHVSMMPAVHALVPQMTEAGGKQASAPVISEIVADTTAPENNSGIEADAFEYMEIYNPTDQTLSLDDYQIKDITGEVSTDWKIPEGTAVDPGKTLIIWINNRKVRA